MLHRSGRHKNGCLLQSIASSPHFTCLLQIGGHVKQLKDFGGAMGMSWAYSRISHVVLRAIVSRQSISYIRELWKWCCHRCSSSRLHKNLKLGKMESRPRNLRGKTRTKNTENSVIFKAQPFWRLDHCIVIFSPLLPSGFLATTLVVELTSLWTLDRCRSGPT